MKIAYVCTFLPQQCGIATYLDYLIRGIKAVNAKLQITVLAEKAAAAVSQERLEIIPCWSRNENYVEQILGRLGQVDVIHVQHEYGIYRMDERLPRLLEGLPSAIAKVVTIHCIIPAPFSDQGAVHEDYAARIAKAADRVIVHLETQKEILCRLGVSPETIHVIAHGTELNDEEMRSSRRRLDLPEAGRILLMFGYIKPHKGFHLVLRALKRTLQTIPDATFFIAGGLPPDPSRECIEYVALIRKQIQQLKLEKHVIFPNKFFPNEDVRYLIAAADVVLFPYYEEDRSASGSLHLALGARKPVIATRIPKFEDLKNVCDELLALPDNAAVIARILIRLFQDPRFEQYVIRRADQYRQITSWPEVANKHLHVYGEAKSQKESADP